MEKIGSWGFLLHLKRPEILKQVLEGVSTIYVIYNKVWNGLEATSSLRIHPIFPEDAKGGIGDLKILVGFWLGSGATCVRLRK